MDKNISCVPARARSKPRDTTYLRTTSNIRGTSAVGTILSTRERGSRGVSALGFGVQGGFCWVELASLAECIGSLTFGHQMPAASTPHPTDSRMVIIKNSPLCPFPNSPLEGGTSPATASLLGAPGPHVQVKPSLRASSGLGDRSRSRPCCPCQARWGPGVRLSQTVATDLATFHGGTI